MQSGSVRAGLLLLDKNSSHRSFSMVWRDIHPAPKVVSLGCRPNPYSEHWARRRAIYCSNVASLSFDNAL
jgi:hypothetical protein